MSELLVPICAFFPEQRKLFSRSQARALFISIPLQVEHNLLILDFDNIDNIGQAFADEIFRVFAHENPNLTLKTINANHSVLRWIARASQH